MRSLVIGLGSMGKRRIRCLATLGNKDILGFDVREDRRKEAEQKYNIKTYGEIKDIDFNKVDVIIISCPPDLHLKYARIAVDNNIPAFIEAGVISKDTEELIKYKNKKNKDLFIAPSCTLIFNPIIKEIKEIILSNKYGKVTNFSYHSGQYLPDWHPWENIKDFYVSKRETSAAREIVPFELTWIVNILGYPEEIKGFFSKTMDLGINIEDTYAFIMRFNGNYLGNIIVDVVSRFAIRKLVINLENAQLQWNWEERFFKLYEADKSRWIKYSQPDFQTETGYNKNISENMYVEEIKFFLKGIKNNNAYPYSLEDELKIEQLLNKIEESDGGFIK